eukprot:g26359.t1
MVPGRIGGFSCNGQHVGALLSVLRILDLSHNRIQDCAEHLKPLSELEYVNLSYNLLERVPIFSSCSRVQLTTLLLRNNSLENIN